MSSHDEALHPRGQAANAGQFRAKSNSAPVATLEAPATPADDALAFIGAEPRDGLTEAQREGYRDAGEQFADERLFAQQPLSYIGFLASEQHEHAARRAESVAAASPTVHAYWKARAERLDQIADELFRLAGQNRYPNRAPENVGSDTRTGEDVVRELFAEHGDRLAMIDPAGLGATRRAVANGRGEPDGQVRLVGLSWASVPPSSSGAPLEVSGPKDDRPIIIDVRSGCPTMRVTSGHAVIIAGGNGFGITVADGARVTMIAQPATKIGLTAEPGAEVDFYPEGDTRGYQSVAEGSTFRMHGRADKVTLSTDRSEVA